MNILDQIKIDKIAEVQARKHSYPLEKIKASSNYSIAPSLLSKRIAKKKSAFLIAEFKRKSPSKGIIRAEAHPAIIAAAYERAGASAISVLTDSIYFGALAQDFSTVRKKTDLPLLRKDFIIDPYQVYETKAMGADIMLLIAAMLSREEVDQLASIGRALGLDILLELHDESEIDHINESVTMVGINNRDLKTFQVDLNKSVALKSSLPKHLPAIAESGLSHPEHVTKLLQAGFDGFLVGESFMKSVDPGKTCLDFVKTIQHKQNAD